MNTKVMFKGKKDGLELLVSNYQDFESFARLVEAKLRAMGEFLQTSPVQMQVHLYGDCNFEVNEEAALIILLEKYSLKYAGKKVATTSAIAEKQKQSADKQVVTEVNFAMADGKTIVERGACLIVYKTLRGGQYIRYPLGSVLVIGDVNPGAKIAAEGDIIITGSTRGELHAGVLGDDNASITAKNIIGGQLRIGTKIAIADDGAVSKEKGMERAIVEDDHIVILNL